AAAPNSDVADLRLFVEFAPDPMSHEVGHDSAAKALGKLLDGCADVAQPRAGLDLTDAELERAPRYLRDLFGVGAGSSNVERRRRIPMEPVVDVRDVDVDDVAVDQPLGPGDAMADDMVDGRAN